MNEDALMEHFVGKGLGPEGRIDPEGEAARLARLPLEELGVLADRRRRNWQTGHCP